MQAGAEILLARCSCPPHVAKQRIASRIKAATDPSEARVDLLDEQSAEEEPYPTSLKSVNIDTLDVESQLQNLSSALRDKVALP